MARAPYNHFSVEDSKTNDWAHCFSLSTSQIGLFVIEVTSEPQIAPISKYCLEIISTLCDSK